MRCDQFGDVLSRRTEHLDDEIIRALHPTGTWVGHVSTGKFPAEQGVEHTFDRFENVFPDLTTCWENVTAAACVGKPCDPSEQKIGMGFTRDSYRLQRKAYASDLLCWDQILSADRAKQQFAHYVRMLRRASSIINSHRLRTEAARIAKYKWALSNSLGTGMVPITMVWDSTCTFLTVSALPTSKVTAKHLQRRVTPQRLEGALEEDIVGPDGKTSLGAQPLLEYVTDEDSKWAMVEGDSNLTDHWRFSDFGTEGQKYYKLGWINRLGDYGLRADLMPLRFNLYRTNADGTYTLQVVFPYTNIAATEGIKEALNNDWLAAPYQIDFIWHRMAMTALVRDTTSINPEMPFAMRDFGGKWQFVMDNLTCGTDVNGNPIAVDNKRRNKGMFIADFAYATQAKYPEFAEAFLTLREQACVVDVPNCADDPGYPAQSYDSGNAPCPEDDVTLTFTPIATDAGTYEVPENSILCNGMAIVNAAVTGTTTLAALVIQLNTLAGTKDMGTWAVAGVTTITLVGTACSDVNIPWQVD
jgi:hypothetical protein